MKTGHIQPIGYSRTIFFKGKYVALSPIHKNKKYLKLSMMYLIEVEKQE